MSTGYSGQPVGPTRASGGSRQVASASGTTNLADILERVLDKGIVIAGDITVSLGQVELLSIRVRLIVASIDKAQEIGIDWWRSDPALSSQAKQLQTQNEQLKARLDSVEDRLRSLPAPQGVSNASNASTNDQQHSAPDSQANTHAAAPEAQSEAQSDGNR